MDNHIYHRQGDNYFQHVYLLKYNQWIYNTLKTTPKNALTGTIVTNTICLMNGAKMIRVHDVKEAKETVKIINLIKQNHLDWR